MAETKTLRSLSELTVNLKLYVPKIRKVPQLDPGDMETMIAEKVKVCQQIQEDVANALKFLCDVKRLLECQPDRTGRKIVESETKKDVAEMREYLEDVLSVEDPIYLQTAVLAYIGSALSQEFSDHEQAHTALHDLEEREILIKAGPDGPVTIGYQHFELNSVFGFETEDVAEINKAAAKFSRRLKSLEYQRRQEKERETRNEADIDLAEALNGANGKCLVEVPSESYEATDGTEGWRGGGKMLTSFTDKEIFPIVGVGSIERSVETMSSLGISLNRYELNQGFPPGIGRAFSNARKDVMSRMGINWEDAGAFLKKKQAFWHLLRRGVLKLRDKEAMEQLREELQAKAEISAEQFFELNGAEGAIHGTACLFFEGAFQQKEGGSVYNLFFLAKKGEENGRKTVEIAEVPDHLQGLLGNFVGKPFPAENNFSNCPGHLRRMFRGIRGQMDMAREIAKI